jgi:alkylated DNA nucleotide flippase Atl1
METIGTACLDYARDLRHSDVRTAELTIEPDADPAGELALGARQREMVDVLRVADDDGLTTAEISQRMGGHDTANAHMSLKGLEARSVIEQVPGRRPIKWRLAPRYRATAEPYLAVAEHIQAGEWTTYGDVSIAVRGDTQGARAVGRAAATLEHFPNPHRILQSGGRIPEGWRTTASEVPNPEVCRERLENDGITFDENGRASRDNYVGWDLLVERMGREAAA